MKRKHDKILKIVFEKLEYFKYSDRTIDTYMHYIEKFLISVDKYPEHASSRTTEIYTHVSNRTLNRVILPI